MHLTRQQMLRNLVEAAERDPQIVGLVDYGSASEGRVDIWSDVDVALFIRDAEFEVFVDEWKDWAARFGDLLLTFPGVADHPWTVYDAEPLPLRVDFNFYPASASAQMLTLPNSPISVDAMVLYDETGGEIRTMARQLVGRYLGPEDHGGAFERASGGFWYYLLRTESALRRDQHWSARWNFTTMVTGNLCGLLRLESGAVDRWNASDAAAGIDYAVTARRRAQLNSCIPGPAQADLRIALLRAAYLGTEVCSTLSVRHGWPWPGRLARRTIDLLHAAASVEKGEEPGLPHSPG
jgi:predicted nucleotidyltransferase